MNHSSSILQDSDFDKQFYKEALDQEKIKQLVARLDISDSKSVLHFGTEAQKQLTHAADVMLRDATSKELGNSGALLGRMIDLMRGFQGETKKLEEKPSFFAKLFKQGNHKFVQFMRQFDSVSDQIDQISNALEAQKQTLLIDIESLDRLYAGNLAHFRSLEHYIAAAEEVLSDTDTRLLPELYSKSQQNEDMQAAQVYRDAQSHRAELDRRLNDLRLTRQVAMQALPSIRLIQENDKNLVNKINSTLLNTIPLWRQQLAQSLAIYRSTEAAKLLKASHDLTNDLLIANAENLKIANQNSRIEIERATFDIEAVEKANQLLIETIEDSLNIHARAREQRQDSHKRLQQAESALKQSLTQAMQYKG